MRLKDYITKTCSFFDHYTRFQKFDIGVWSSVVLVQGRFVLLQLVFELGKYFWFSLVIVSRLYNFFKI